MLTVALGVGDAKVGKHAKILHQGDRANVGQVFCALHVNARWVGTATMLKEAGVDVIGVNCSGGPAQLLRILKQMVQAIPDRSVKFWVKPNAGWPEQVGGRIMYPADAEYFGEYALSFREVGACIVGGCKIVSCGELGGCEIFQGAAAWAGAIECQRGSGFCDLAYMKRRMCSNYPIAQAADVEYERAQEQGHPRGIAVGIEDSPVPGAIGMYLHSKGAFCLDDRSGKVDHLLAWNAMRHPEALPPQVVCYLLHILRANADTTYGREHGV